MYKIAKCKEYEGAEAVLSYKDLGNKVKAIKKNTLIYGSAAVTKAIASYADEKEDKIFVTVRKSPVFDVGKALEYSIPLLNVKEFEEFTKADEIKKAIEKLEIGQVIFTEESITDELIDVAKDKGVVIVECGFLSNPDELERLKDDAHQNKIAEGICIGIEKYFDIYLP